MYSGYIGMGWYISGEKMVYYKVNKLFKNLKSGSKCRWGVGVLFYSTNTSSTNGGANHGTFM